MIKQISLITLTLISIISTNILNAQTHNKEDKELREKISQMLIVGFRAMELETSNEIYDLITKEKIGGVILFDYDVPSKKSIRNIESPDQLRTLCTELQKAGNNRLFISIDQEGGRVSRLKEKYGFPPTVSQQYLGDNNNKSLTTQWSARAASTLKSLGINLNFTPSVDLNVNPDCPIIGKLERSFSSNPKVIVENAKIVIQEHKKQGIATAIKHFPGHGSSTSDTHEGIVDVTKTYTEEELIPFRELIDEGVVDMVMTSHVFNANFDSLYPATMSYNTLTNKLKLQMEYKGIIISDDMAMGAISKQYDLETCLEKAINAGVDMFIFSNNGEKYDKEIGYKAIDTIFQLVKQGKVKESSINNSFSKISKLKSEMGLR
ncbi:MAG: glycoside hydrolase family 3 N-terminal domain-containing protein [Bacteroidales bacterium]|nr:glycoside hydrolase family 3 N-terminal domain-containing protein [Bacteroidales bacterium]MDD4529302.1 glycoside hydrolase family 3 N-terminal domain-containing protein [Bacteroidales bacterium]MDD4829229.1 glycoside hydrolase family 3 N-terminal domain-containing protein [Bacteroidales bacterium]